MSKPLVTFTQSGTTDDGYPFVRFLTPYGAINVKATGPDHMTVSLDPDAYLTVSGVEIRGSSVVRRKPHNDEQPEWSHIDYNARYWRRRHNKPGTHDDYVSSSARERLDALTLAAVAEALRVRPDITHKARVAVLTNDIRRTTAEIDQHRTEIATLERDRANLEELRRTLIGEPAPSTPARDPWTPVEALQLIQGLMDGREWDADTCDGIAAIVRAAGYEVRDVDEMQTDETA